MATRQYRLSKFDQGAPPTNRPLELLCEDKSGTYLLPYLCHWSDGVWRNSAIGGVIEANVIGWRVAPTMKWNCHLSAPCAPIRLLVQFYHRYDRRSS